MLIAAHGTCSLTRQFGDRSGAVWPASASRIRPIVTQLVHLDHVTIVWLPVALLLIDRVLTPGERRRPHLQRARVRVCQRCWRLSAAAYICGLVLMSFACFRTFSPWRRLGPIRQWLPPLAGIAAALALGSAAGAVVLLPVSELASVSDRSGPLNYEWATYTNFWPPMVFSFFAPYLYGDLSDLSYIGPPSYPETYGYVGALTAILAIYGAAREWRRALVAFLIAMTLLAFGFILGPRTPVYATS